MFDISKNLVKLISMMKEDLDKKTLKKILRGTETGGWGDYSAFRHAQKRALERHGIEIDIKVYRELCLKALNAPIKRKAKGGRKVVSLPHKKKRFRVVFDPTTNTILTFLPKMEKKS